MGCLLNDEIFSKEHSVHEKETEELASDLKTNTTYLVLDLTEDIELESQQER